MRLLDKKTCNYSTKRMNAESEDCLIIKPDVIRCLTLYGFPPIFVANRFDWSLTAQEVNATTKNIGGLSNQRFCPASEEERKNKIIFAQMSKY